MINMEQNINLQLKNKVLLHNNIKKYKIAIYSELRMLWNFQVSKLIDIRKKEHDFKANTIK